MIWGSLSEDKGQIEKHLVSTCFSDYDQVKLLEITNSYFSLTYNPTQDRFVTSYSTFILDHIRKMIINYDSNTHENILDNVYALNLANANALTETWIRNNVFTNVSGLQGAVFYEFSPNVIVENKLHTTNVTMRNTTISNVNGTGSLTNYYTYLIMNEGGTISFDQIHYLDYNIGQQAGFYAAGVIGSLAIKNSIFSDITVGSSNALISTGEFDSLTISNITFANINNEEPDKQNNYMMRIHSINLNDVSNSLINDIAVQDSDISFMLFQQISGKTSSF